jgi:predicted transcriptional regulator
MERTKTNKRTLFGHIIIAATNISSKRRRRRVRGVLSHVPARFAFLAISAILLLLSSLLAIEINQSALRSNSKSINRTNIRLTRDRSEVFATMLEAAINGGIKKFDILYKAHLDLKDFHANMQLLLQNGLLMREALLIKEEYSGSDNTNGYYRTTNKGYVYIELYRELERLCPPLTVCMLATS